MNSGIPTPTVQTNRFLGSASANTTQSSSTGKQRGQTAIGGISAEQQQRNQQLKLKKADTVRGTSDFPKSTSTDKSRIESFLNRNVPNNSSSINSQDNHEPLRTSHSYRTKGTASSYFFLILQFLLGVISHAQMKLDCF